MSQATTPALVKPSVPRVLPLQHGDRLTRAEFERRYEASAQGTKAELIEGVVYMPPPVSHSFHSAPQFELIAWLGTYRAATPGVLGGDNGSLRLDLDNEPQPDAYLMLTADRAGRPRLDADGYVQVAPELVAEVTASTASYDLHIKMQVYRRSGVPEYVVWRTLEPGIDWFVLREGEYQRLAPDAAGVYRSEVFPGLWLDAAALLRGDLTAVLQLLNQGLGSPEHTAFVAKLQQPR